jgi:hypothetical protein
MTPTQHGNYDSQILQVITDARKALDTLVPILQKRVCLGENTYP